MKKFLSRLLGDNLGTSTIEMGMICAMIVLAMMSALHVFADGSVGMWNNIHDKTENAIHGSSS